MMRNVAIGAVLGFGVMVLVLSIFGMQAPSQSPAPVAVTVAPLPDASVAPTLVPLKMAPISPRVRQFRHANPGDEMVVLPPGLAAQLDAGR